MKAKNCDECQFFNVELTYPFNVVCSKGHKPRFYKPATLSDAHRGDWGFKRRCNDFKVKQ